MATVWGGIEAGGTHFVCAIGTGPDDIREECRLATSSPEETIGHTIDFFRSHRQHHPVAAVGIASFGPVNLDESSPTYGHITSTPKQGWANTDMVGAVRRSLHLPVGFDTDVNAAALAEHEWGNAKGLDSFVYLTVGTGIGGGGMVNGQLLHGLVHPEMGHIRIPRSVEADAFDGCCPYHGDCLEGLASGPAMKQRWGRPPENIPQDHPAWELEATYLGLAVANIVCTLSPQLVVMGGGVMEQPQLLPRVRRKVQELLNGYVQAEEILQRIDDYIVASKFGRRVGVLGAIALARRTEVVECRCEDLEGAGPP